MKQITTITVAELKQMAQKMFGGLVKVDVDIARNVVVIDMDLHADGEAYLLQNGSKQTDLWGINVYPEKFGTDGFIEFDSMINLRPSQGNPSRDVLDAGTKKKIRELITGVVHD